MHAMSLFAAARQSLSTMWSNHLRYQQIYNELRQMNQRELAELGLDQHDAAGIALRTVQAELARAPRSTTRNIPSPALVRA